MKFSTLVLSDIHITDSSDPILSKAEEIAKCTYAHIRHADSLLVLLAGDIAFSGLSEQYKLAEGFLRSIAAYIKNENKDLAIHYVCVPGNHDCDFSTHDSIRDLLIESITQGSEIDDQRVDACTKVQKNYFDFRDAVESTGEQSAVGDKLWRTTTIRISNNEVVIDAINMAWMSKKKEKEGTLRFPWEIYQDKYQANGSIRLGLLHQPWNWLKQEDYRPMRKFLRRRADFIISGHEHGPNSGINTDTESGDSFYLETGALQEGKAMAGSTFCIVDTSVEGEKRSVCVKRYLFDSKDGYLPVNDPIWKEPKSLPTKVVTKISLSSSFRERFDDPGTPFRTLNGNTIHLSNFYVFPDLTDLRAGDSDNEVSFIKGQSLCDIASLSDPIVISGDEKAGRTSLLYRLYEAYVDADLFPVFIEGRDLKHTQEDEARDVIAKAFREQYIGDIESYNQLPIAKKIILIDNYNDSPIQRKEHKQKLLEVLGKECSHMILSCVKDESLASFTINGKSLKRYSLRPMGYRARQELIKRWHESVSDYTVSESELLIRCDESERLVNAVMTKKVIPSVPLYLVALLHSVTHNKSAELIDSALGDYYRYLIFEGFKSAKVPFDKIGEMFDYCAHMAWHFHKEVDDEDEGEFAIDLGLSEEGLRAFNNKYSDTYIGVPFESRRDILVRAGVLRLEGGAYKFKYPYAYYYLKGMHMSRFGSDELVSSHVDTCCGNLSIRDHANTLTFLAHHATGETLASLMRATLDRVHKDIEPAHFNGDTALINELVKRTPELIYRGGAPQQHREEQSELRDRISADHDDDADNDAIPDETDELFGDHLSNVTLFRASEVIGLILKAQYYQLTHEQREELLTSIFLAHLRGLRRFYDILCSHPDLLNSEVINATNANEDKKLSLDKKRQAVERTIILIVQIVSFGFLMHASNCVRSEKLIDSVKAVSRAKDSLAFDLIEMALLLDNGNLLPRDALRQLKRKLGRSTIAYRLLSFFVLYRLYMFETTADDKLWVCREFGFQVPNGDEGGALSIAPSKISGLLGS